MHTSCTVEPKQSLLAALNFASPGASYTAGQSAHLPGVAAGLSPSVHHLFHPLPTHPATSSCGQTIPLTQTRVQGSSPVMHPTLCQALAALQVMSSRCDSSLGPSSAASSSGAWPCSYCCLVLLEGTSHVSPASLPTTSKSLEFCQQRLNIEYHV